MAAFGSSRQMPMLGTQSHAVMSRVASGAAIWNRRCRTIPSGWMNAPSWLEGDERAVHWWVLRHVCAARIHHEVGAIDIVGGNVAYRGRRGRTSAATTARRGRRPERRYRRSPIIAWYRKPRSGRRAASDHRVLARKPLGRAVVDLIFSGCVAARCAPGVACSIRGGEADVEFMAFPVVKVI